MRKRTHQQKLAVSELRVVSAATTILYVQLKRNPTPQYDTAVKQKQLALLQAVYLLVAGTGFEPVTFGL